MTSDGDALFQAVCENPADDTPRLAYADWLQENDRPERGEFIRLQCEAWSRNSDYPSLTAIRERASQLLHANVEMWHAELPMIDGVGWSDLFVRGFIDAARILHARDLLETLMLVFRVTPLRHLTIDDIGSIGLQTLLTTPQIGGLWTLRLPQFRATPAMAQLLDEARIRFPNTRIV